MVWLPALAFHSLLAWILVLPSLSSEASLASPSELPKTLASPVSASFLCAFVSVSPPPSPESKCLWPSVGVLPSLAPRQLF